MSAEFSDLGIGVAAVGELEIVVLVCALSAAADFELLTRALVDLDAVRATLLERTNEARQAWQRRPLRSDRCLDKVAQTYAESMFAEGFYGHVSPDGGDVGQRVKALGCEARKIGENLARGQPTPEEVIADWLDSGGHRRNLLDREYDGVGFGLAYGRHDEDYEVLWVQVLGKS